MLALCQDMPLIGDDDIPCVPMVQPDCRASRERNVPVYTLQATMLRRGVRTLRPWAPPGEDVAGDELHIVYGKPGGVR